MPLGASSGPNKSLIRTLVGRRLCKFAFGFVLWTVNAVRRVSAVRPVYPVAIVGLVRPETLELPVTEESSVGVSPGVFRFGGGHGFTSWYRGNGRFGIE